MKRVMGFAYGVLCYVFFLFVFLKAIWFVANMDNFVPQGPLSHALLINAALLGAFAVQHSGMARQGFKRAWTKIVPSALERSTYVLASNVALLLVVEFWQPVPGVIWTIQNPVVVMILRGAFWFGWGLLFTSTLLIDHFDLFGVKQAWKYLRKEEYEPPKFRTPWLYRMVRHPLYLGFLISFWSAPRMTSSHLFFAVMCTGFILFAIQLEERDLVSIHGEAYRNYKKGVPMLLPLPGKKAAVSAEPGRAASSARPT